MSESSIIKLIKSKFFNEWETIYGNDSAFLSENDIVITKDVLVEGTHFESYYPIDSIAYKSLAVNISDILSDGGEPAYFLLGIGYPKNYEEKIISLFENYYHICNKYNLKIIGGDLVYSPVFFISVTCIGYTKSPWLRKNAGDKDILYLTGSIGGSYKGFKEIKNNYLDLNNRYVISHLYPPIRIKEVEFIKDKYTVSAGIDISDGLIKDLVKLALESKKAVFIEYDLIPFFDGLSDEEKFSSLFWGEDYEICFSSNQIIKEDFIKQIGYIEDGKPGLYLKKDQEIIIYSNIEEIEKKEFSHW
ncbi:MAG TPA: thiamine-phosphate kinase [Spirochaetota bacterium]|nr:thiamine-phosphate kinase [Spirochaetota bacterium]HOM37984.1 thiamine-phosphate kinase [Spirochaetota bacterium]HPQ48789.1 thiamine-phosphate kinase [Spirochaetota bacterium]